MRGKRFAPLLLAALLAATAGCYSADQTAKRAVVSAADAQADLAGAYLDALAQEQAAVKSCKAAAITANRQLPAPEDVAGNVKACAELGRPMPFDPAKLASFGRDVNAMKEGVTVANEIRKGVAQGLKTEADYAGQLDRLKAITLALIRGAADLGIKLGPAVQQFASGGAR